VQKIRVCVNGYGTIGKRVADAVALQPDMELVGVTAHSMNYRIDTAYRHKGFNIFSLDGEVYKELEANGIKVSGSLDELLGSVDVIDDCSPKNGVKNKEIYQQRGVKAVFQGGEKKNIASDSFVSQCDYSRALGKDYLRVVSCNTTALCRTLHAIDKKYGVNHAHGVLLRRGTDSHDNRRGPINAIESSSEKPSHHGEDVRTVLERLQIFTTAYIVPTTLMHMHDLMLDMRDAHFDVNDIIELLNATPRILVLKSNHGIESTAQVMDYHRDLLRNPRGDVYETGILDGAIGIYRVHGYNRLFITQCVHQESNVVPENIDAIRAVMGFDDSKIPEEYRSRVEAAREAYMKSPLHSGLTDDKMEEVNPSRIITDITLNIFKGI